jgi:uncharacterized RDD family membrane protein YckC
MYLYTPIIGMRADLYPLLKVNVYICMRFYAHLHVFIFLMCIYIHIHINNMYMNVYTYIHLCM